MFSSGSATEIDTPLRRAACRGETAGCGLLTTSAMSSRFTRIFIRPTATSKTLSSIWRWTTAVLPSDLSLTVVSGGDVAHNMRLGVGVAAIGAGVPRHHRGIELLAEFAPQLGHAAFGFL